MWGKYALEPGKFDWLLQVIWRITKRVTNNIWSTDKFAICKILDFFSSCITWHTLKFSLKRARFLNFTYSELQTMFRQETVKTDCTCHDMSATHSIKTSWVLIIGGLYLCSVLAFTMCLLCRYEKKLLMVSLVHGLVSSKQIPRKIRRIYIFSCVIKFIPRLVARKQRQNLDQK